MNNKTRVTIPTSELAKKLFEYAKRLGYADMVQLDRMLRDRVRLIVFHIDGDRVSLVESEPAIQLGPQEPPDNPMIYNRWMPDGSYRDIAGFFERA